MLPSFILRLVAMSVTTGATVVQADHHKLMLTASPLGRNAEIIEPGHAHGVVGMLVGFKEIDRDSLTLDPERFAQQIRFRDGSTGAFTLTMPTVPELADRFNLQNGSYIEIIIINVGATDNGAITLAVAANSGFALLGPAAIATTSVAKVGVYIRDRTSLVNGEGGHVFQV